MKKIKKFLSKPMVSIVALLIGAACLMGSTVNGTRAALTYFSETYTSRVSMLEIGVSLLENGERVAWRDYKPHPLKDESENWSETNTASKVGNLLTGIAGKEYDKAIEVNRPYEERLAVQNTGSINQYVRVELKKYWVDDNGKRLSVSPKYIDLNLINKSVWLEDKEASTTERTVLYYANLLKSGETTPDLSDTFKISKEVGVKATQTTETRTEGGKTYTTITTVYDYDGLQYRLEAKVDAIQEHNAKEAIKSAWGQNVSINNGVLSLN